MSQFPMPDMVFLSRFIPPQELAVLKGSLRGEESAFFKEMLADWEKAIKAMPGLYDESMGIDAPITLHYFFGAVTGGLPDWTWKR